MRIYNESGLIGENHFWIPSRHERILIMKKSSSKKALLASAAALSMSAILFAGTTFAWFTDSASSAVSTIQSGNLDVAFQVWNGKEYVDITDTVDIFNTGSTDKDLWEPGHVETAYVRVKNDGSLSLKYQLNLVASANTFTNVKGDKTSLSEYIKYGIETSKEDLVSYDSRSDAVDALAETSITWTDGSGSGVVYEDTLTPGDTSYDYIAITAYMPESVDNSANYDSSVEQDVPEISYKLYLSATQTPDEEDSYGNDYDANVSYDKSAVYIDQGYTPVAAGEKITSTQLQDGPVVLTGNAVKDGAATNADFVVELNGNTLTPSYSYNVTNPGNDLTVSLTNGEYVIGDVSFGNLDVRPSASKNADVTIDNMTFTSTKTSKNTDYPSAEKAIQYTPEKDCTGTLNITNSTFNQTYIQIAGMSDKESTINVVFENCTFNMTGSYSPVQIGAYLSGNITFKNCTFNLVANNASLYAISVGSANVAITFEGVNTINDSRYETATSGSVGIHDYCGWYATINGIKYSSFNASNSNGTVVFTGTAH
jgi:predicted ribosomally synthesized peptide with SipW-like signal peptide